MVIHCVWEHNGDDSLLYSVDDPGSFSRGDSLEIALGKICADVKSYRKWAGFSVSDQLKIEIVQEKISDLNIRDADSDVLFDAEHRKMSLEEYQRLKSLVIQSAEDFQALYDAIPNKAVSCLAHRRTFYGPVPRTAEEMYLHTKSVNAYYFAEIDVAADNEGSITECRKRGFSKLEEEPLFLEKPVCTGSYGEQWSLRKVMRRFLWHDRIHAKAMYRMAVRTFDQPIPNVFYFEV